MNCTCKEIVKCACESSDALSWVAIIISIIAIVWEWHGQNKINKINLRSEYFKELFFDILLNNIPNERSKIRFDKNGYLKDYKDFVENVCLLLEKSMYYKYIDANYYNDLRKKVMELEDYVLELANKSINEALHTEIFNEIDEKTEGVYGQLIKKYEKG